MTGPGPRTFLGRLHLGAALFFGNAASLLCLLALFCWPLWPAVGVLSAGWLVTAWALGLARLDGGEGR